MEYDPAVSTHKASSITSTTSTSSSSTWEHPYIPTNNHLKVEETIQDYCFDADRIAIPPFEFTNSNHFPDAKRSLMVEEEALPELIPAQDIKKEYHEKDSSDWETYFHKDNQPHDNMNIITPIYLQHGDRITVPTISLMNSSNSFIRPAATTLSRNSTSTSSNRQTTPKRSRLNKDLLTDDEKRMNHIASEQKRRNTIRLGFKELTEIIPTLKNINNSKSTILFKAVDYIKHLDKRNRGLREKVSSLKMRIELMDQRHSRPNVHDTAFSKDHSNHHSQRQQHHRLSIDEFSHLPANTVSALIAHKNQQRQLEELQEQLRAQQQLLAKHNIVPNAGNNPITTTTVTSSSTTTMTTSFIPDLYSAATTTPTSNSHSQTSYQYSSISIPASRNSSSDENLHHHHQSLIVPQDLQELQQVSSCPSQSTKRRPWQSANA